MPKLTLSRKQYIIGGVVLAVLLAIAIGLANLPPDTTPVAPATSVATATIVATPTPHSISLTLVAESITKNDLAYVTIHTIPHATVLLDVYYDCSATDETPPLYNDQPPGTYMWAWMTTNSCSGTAEIRVFVRTQHGYGSLEKDVQVP